jgi:hypothetical protein
VPLASERAQFDRWRQNYPFGFALFVTGLLVNLCFSRMGFMPLDASIVFDGGWRILDGQVPWRDFTTPNGVVPAAIQALFFAIAGPTWFAFCLHASVVNGAFGVLMYVLLVVLRLPRPLAFFYALCGTFFFYPPVGVPFMEQHSFFFTLAAITAAVTGNYSPSSRAQWWLWALVPALGLLAFFSKQVPFGFAAPVLPLILLLPGRSSLRTRFTAVAQSIACCTAVIVVFGLVLRIPWTTVFEYTFVRPGEVGGLRAVALPELASRVARRFDNLPTALGLDFIGNAVFMFRAALIALPLMFLVRLMVRRRAHESAERVDADPSRLACALILAPMTYVTSLLLGFVTNNQTQNSVAFYPVAAGLLHAAICAELRILQRGIEISLPAGAFAAKLRGWLPAATALALVAISIAPLRHWMHDTVIWTGDVNMTRMVNDMTFNPALAAASARSLPAGMEFLRWTPSPANYDLDGWRQLTEFLRSREGNVLIIGDTLVTYALIGKPSVAPNLWFHPGLAMPDSSEPAFADYERELTARITSRDVRFIVLEGDATRLRFSIDQLPALNAWLHAAWTETHRFGPNRVYEPGRR